MNSHKTKSILFLGYDKFQTKIIEALEDKNCKVTHQSNNLNKISNDFDLVISFGFKHIIKNDLLQSITAPILNLHQSYLPWNKGAHPNFWSFWDNTPAGVTIHKIDSGIDTGPIVVQRIFEFDEKVETFRTTYEKLFTELENLFISNIDNIVNSEHFSNILLSERITMYIKYLEVINKHHTKYISRLILKCKLLIELFNEDIQIKQIKQMKDDKKEDDNKSINSENVVV